MTFRPRRNKAHPKVQFSRHYRNMAAAAATTTSASNIGSLPTRERDAGSSIPSLFTTEPPIQDELETHSSKLQAETVEECLPFLKGEEHQTTNAHVIPRLDRERHVKFLHKQLGNLPPQFFAADASRPWFFYWCLAALSLFGEDVTVYRDRLIKTVRPMQNPDGGFGGGFGQLSHLATSYATVLALALVGGEEAYEVVDRKTMWKWLSSIKQADGGFQMAVGGEEDVRGAYCASVIISLLNLPLELSPDSPAYAAGHRGLFSGLGEWVRRCQTYEGGVSAMPGVEGHGAYAFCALGCLSIIDSPHRSIPKYMDVPKLISWLSARQYAPEGGFSGRTNKLVDGCYSHWVGGCWPLIEASMASPDQDQDPDPDPKEQHRPCVGSVDHGNAATRSSLFSREALIRYIMTCCQDLSKRGGLRDKPSKYSDAYHTCYVLSGLSSAQHQWTLVSSRPDEIITGGDTWAVIPCMEGEQIFDEDDRVGTTHPVYVIPQHKVNDAQKYFASKLGF